MQLLRTIGSQKQQSKSLLLNTVKTLSTNLIQLKNTLSNFLIQGSDTGDQHLQKLSEISSKQTVIMNRIRLGMEKQQSEIGSPIKASWNLEKRQSQKQQDFQELQKVFEEQNLLENKRNQLLGKMSQNLQRVFGNMNENYEGVESENKGSYNQTDDQIKRIVNSLKKDPNCRDLQKWAGTLYINIMSEYYTEHIKGTRSFQDTKMEMSFAILQKYRKLVLDLSSCFDLQSVERFEERFQQAAFSAISYLVAKCPMSKQTIDVSIFQKLANKADLSKHPDHDLLNCLNIQFDPTNSSIGPTLKTLIGKIIEEVNLFYPEFKNFINGIMDRVDSKTGFTYNIERKILEGVSPYSEDQIMTPGFFTKSNELMRTLVKWIQSLILPFKNPAQISHQFNLFQSPEGLERLNQHQKQEMMEKFEKRRGKMNETVKSMNLFLQRTLSSIIVISNNPLGSDRIQSFPFLDNSASSILLICRYIWKTIEGFANEIIRQILKLYQQITDEYSKENRREEHFKLYGFFIQDLLSCECKGNKDSILLIYQNLIKQQQSGKIKILQISNNLLKPPQNIVILFKHTKSFLTFQIRLRLTGKKGDQKDEFNRFLRQLEKTILTPTFMLASNLINLNPIKEYLKKYKPYFKPNLQPFTFNIKDRRIECKSHPEAYLKEGIVANSFVCNMCFLFVESYTHYFPKKFCTECYLNMCFVCQLKLLPQEEIFQYLLSPLKKIKQYFEPLEIYKYQEPEAVKQSILNHFHTHLSDYLLVVNFKNSTNQKYVYLLKSLTHHSEQLILTNFNNKKYDFNKGGKSLVILLKPIHPHFTSNPTPHKQQNIHQIQQNYQQTTEQKQCIYLQNKSKSSKVMIDYKISQASKIKQIISATEIQRIIKCQNKTKEGKLSFDKLIINLSLFKSIKSVESILVLDFNECELDTSNKLQQLNIFSNLQELFISNTPSFKYNTQFKFNQSIVSINIAQSQLADFQFDFPKLKQLRLTKNKLTSEFKIKSLPKLHTLKLSDNKINSFWNLSTAELPSLLKLDLRNNNIEIELPVLKFEKLSVLELSDNKIKSIENLSKSQLPSLKQLIVNNNQIEVLPNLHNLSRLEVLKISRNRVNKVEALECQSVIILDLSNNNLKQLPSLNYSSLTHLYLNNNQITNLLSLKQLGCYSLETVQLQFNPVEKGKISLIKDLDNIKIHPQALHFNINPKSKCNSKQKLTCTQCSKNILTVRYYNCNHQKLCDQCFEKSKDKPKYKQIYRLDSDVTSKYSRDNK